ncbi:MAG TPA: UDP-N-acetylmuramoyl-L-alanine--D-glutamate ligase [Candidatus Staskawiczbacteria bacterium]|nr:UDP-N-acetylmuramoyl-L-alanine--D-glutamate ligase [Candidatus Staskawiczbacteria bacterium]
MEQIYKGKKIVIMGLGLHGGGVAAARFFCSQESDVLVTDLKTEDQLADSIKKLAGLPIKYTLGGHKEEDFLTADLIVKNPDVPWSSPYIEISKKHNIEVQTDISLFFKLSGAFIIGVTGTKGKTTTASLIYHLLKEKFENLFLAGNNGVSTFELLDKVRAGDKVVLELSSFELEGLDVSPNIAVVTNIMQDHLNRYSGMQDYIEAKKNIFKFQNFGDTLFLNEDDSIVRQFSGEAKSKVIFFSGSKIDLSEMKIFGDHNKANVAAAVAVAKFMEVGNSDIEKSLKTFNGPAARQEFVAEVSGVKYFNDTTATIPEAVVAAIDAFSSRFPAAKIFLICGGVYKGVDYLEMTGRIKEKSVFVILLPGNASEKIEEHLSDYEDMVEVSSMQEAVKTASELAKAGDLVVLSPAASSFNMFKNEFDRGNEFIKSVKSLE